MKDLNYKSLKQKITGLYNVNDTFCLQITAIYDKSLRDNLFYTFNENNFSLTTFNTRVVRMNRVPANSCSHEFAVAKAVGAQSPGKNIKF